MTVRTLLSWCLIAAAFTSSWNAVTLGGIQPVDVFLALAFALAIIPVAGGRLPWIPAWTRVGIIAILLVILTHAVLPTSASYMSQRFVYVPWFAQVTGVDLSENGAVRGMKWLLALAVLPILVADCAREKPELIRRLSTAWLLGATLSAFIAFTDLLGITSVNTFLIVIGGATARQGGLTSHPNHLGMSVAMTAPLAIGLAMRTRWKGILVALILTLGAVVSGSRAGQAGFVLAVAVSLAFSARARRFAPVLIVAAGIATAALVWTKPGLVDTAATLFRFDTTDKYVAQSNEERASLSRQAMQDFARRPIDGVGLEVLTQAHNIFLQVVAGGGIILAAGMLVYIGGALRAAYAERRNKDPLAVYLIVSVAVWLAAGTFGTQLTDRYLYFPVAAIAALQGHRIREARRRKKARRIAPNSDGLLTGDRAILSA